LAKETGVVAAETNTIETGVKYHALLSKRFDRTTDGKRKHFASAMTLLGLTDGCDVKTGNGYLDIVDFILQNCCDVEDNLRQLYRRVAFNIAIGNSDDHFRNHGFLLTPRGWTLSPAYDLNPTINEYQALLINSTTNHADLNVLLESSEEYMIGKEEAKRIIDEVKAGVKQWKSIAIRLGIAKREMDMYEQVYQRALK
jgi:serine/threonine-protein kinase HipA